MLAYLALGSSFQKVVSRNIFEMDLDEMFDMAIFDEMFDMAIWFRHCGRKWPLSAVIIFEWALTESGRLCEAGWGEKRRCMMRTHATGCMQGGERLRETWRVYIAGANVFRS